MHDHRPTARTGSRAARRAAALALLCAGAQFGCSSDGPPPDHRRIPDEAALELDRSFVRDPIAAQAKQAVLRERALHDSDFQPGSARLSRVGKRHVDILAEALRTDGGEIAVDRGEVGEKLYRERLAEVRRTLQQAGIAADRIVAESPDGRGAYTADALRIRERILSKPLPESQNTILDPRGGTMGGSNGGNP
jgi:hypothetical protein